MALDLSLCSTRKLPQTGLARLFSSLVARFLECLDEEERARTIYTLLACVCYYIRSITLVVSCPVMFGFANHNSQCLLEIANTIILYIPGHFFPSPQIRGLVMYSMSSFYVARLWVSGEGWYCSILIVVGHGVVWKACDRWLLIDNGMPKHSLCCP